MNIKELELVVCILKEFSSQLADKVCNDTDEALFKNWTVEERHKFVRKYHTWNGDPEEFDPNDLHLPDYAIVAFLGDLLKQKLVYLRKKKIEQT